MILLCVWALIIVGPRDDEDKPKEEIKGTIDDRIHLYSAI